MIEPADRQPGPIREEALARVLEHRARGRRRPAAARVLLAVLGALLALASAPLLVVLPELGVPVLLAALRLLAVEADWAAAAYAWVDWRFEQARHWIAGRPARDRALVAAALLALAAAIVWLLVRAVL